MMALRPAVQVDRAKILNARPGDRAKLEAAFDLATPATTGVSEHALLLIGRLRIERPLAFVSQEAFAGELIDRIRAAKVTARHGHGGQHDDFYFEDGIALELAIIDTWLDGTRLAQTIRNAIEWSAEPVTRWRRKLLGETHLLPRLVVALLEAGIAAAWFEHFDDGEIAVTANAILRAHGVRPIDGPSESPPDGTGPKRAQPSPAHRTVLPSAMAEPIAIARGTTLRPSLRVLLAVSLIAARRPELLSTGQFHAALSVLRAELPGELPRTSEAVAIAVHTDAIATRPPEATAVPEPAAIASPVPRSRPVPANNRTGSRTQRSSQPPAHKAHAALLRPTSPAELPRNEPAAPAMPVPSAFAGLLFLLNIFVALGLYGNLTDPARQLRGLSPFELLLLLGRRWFRHAFLGDPLERLLRSFAGLAPGERLGRHFDAPVWSVPPGWLAPWPRRPARNLAGACGVSRWHPAGFPIADRWSTTRSPAWLRRRWVACLARYIEARLAGALGTGNPVEALEILARRHGTIAAEGDRIDIAFALDDHPLALRLAGLDRDPGWIPAAGRSFRFHFT